MGIFDGLGAFGLKGTDKVDIFEEEEKEKKDKAAEKKEASKEINEEELLFDKTFTCPVCDSTFKNKMVRTGKVRFAGTDPDLRPKHVGVDLLKYDVVLCPNCGYAALNRYFSFVMSKQAANIREKISANFKNQQAEGNIYTYDDAIMRHKLALLNTVVKNGKNSERAYTCLKLAWLYRGKRELLMQGDYKKEESDELLKAENELLADAFGGFEAAFGKEDFPMCGMDQYTVMYLLAELGRRTGNKEAASRYVSRVLTGRNVKQNLKNMALDLKERLREDGAAQS